MAKGTSMVFQLAPPMSFPVPHEPSGAWILGRRAGPESVPPPSGSTAWLGRNARYARVELLLPLSGRRTLREAGNRPRPAGRIFTGRNMAKTCRDTVMMATVVGGGQQSSHCDVRMLDARKVPRLRRVCSS